MKVKQVVGEHKKGVRAVKYNSKPKQHIEPPKPRNFVAKNQQTSGSGAHTDAKKASQAVRGQKHKGQMDMAESNAGISKDQENKFHVKLDKLVHSTFGHSTDEVEEGHGRYSSYHDELQSRDRDEQGAMDRERRDFKRHELQHELGHERNNLQVTINGRPWKVFPGRGTADSHEEFKFLQSMKAWAEKKSAATGKKWSVHLTGADPSVEEGEGQVTASDPTKGVEITNPQTGVKTTIPPKMANALAPDAQNPNRYTLNPKAVSPGTDDKAAPAGPKVGSQVNIPDQATEEDMLAPTPADSTSPIHGGTVDGDEAGDREHDQIIHLLRKLAGVHEMDNGPVSVQVGSKGDMLGMMKKLGGL